MRNVHDPSQLTSYDPFSRAAPVGNSNSYLNLKELSADDSFSLMENKILLTLSQPFSLKIYKLRLYFSTYL